MPPKNESVKVAIRVRPLNSREKDMNSPVCTETRDNILSIKKEVEAKEFLFDYVFPMEIKQEQIYDQCSYNLVENALEGYNGTIFAYGQTGAGKTFTMLGVYTDPDLKGIIPRTFEHVIGAIHTSQEKKFVVRTSFIEIYNEEIMDLLENAPKVKKSLKESPDRGVFIHELKMVPVKSVDEMFKLLDIGNKNRSVSSTKMNATSSRSHALFTVHVESIQGQNVKGSKINLVDLAGSQRQSKTQATGDRLKEGAKINLSLTALGNVINSLVEGKKGGHIPYRDSKLTRLLQDSLGGNTKTLMIASVSPAKDNYDETLSSLRYAARARNIKNSPKINEDPKDTMIKEYFEEIQRLKKQLALSGGEVDVNQSDSLGDPQAIKEIEEKSKQLLSEKDKQLEEMKQKLKQMEEIVIKKDTNSNPETVETRKKKKKKIQKQEELVSKRIKELEMEDEKLLEETDDSQKKSPEEEVLYLKALNKKLRAKVKNVMNDREDREQEFQKERQDLNRTIRELESDLSFYTQVAAKFMNNSDIETLRSNSTLDVEKRKYELIPFLMYQEKVSLPKTLKKNEVDDLWNEKRKGYKLEFLHEMSPLPDIGSKTVKTKEKAASNIFLQGRRNLINYQSPIYKEKEYTVEQADNHIFRRTDFRFRNSSRSRSKDRSNSIRNTLEDKLKPSSELATEKRPTSKGKATLLQPIVRKE